MGIAELLTVAFVVLKLLGEIAWSWWWVFSPIWITYLMVVPLIAAMWFCFFRPILKRF